MIVQASAAVAAVAVAADEGGDQAAPDEVAGEEEGGEQVPVDEVVGEGEGGGVVPGLLLDGVAREILGCTVKRIKGRHAGGWSYADRISISCCHHDSCSRSRSLALDVDLFGPRSAEFFLVAWLQVGPLIGPEKHGKHVPTRAEVRAYLDL